MKFSCDNKELLAAITKASRASSQKSPTPALEGLLIQAGHNLTITGYDLKRGIYTSIDADVIEPGSIVLNTKLFSEIIRKFPDSKVTITCDNNLLTKLTCNNSDFEIVGINSDDFPALPESDGKSNITLDQAKLRSMINETVFSVSDNEARPVYTGALFDVEDQNLTIVAVDGFRLALRKEELDSCNMENSSFIVPAYALSDVEKICTDDDESVIITVGEKHICFRAGNTFLISRRLDGEFLNYKKSIPELAVYVYKSERSELLKAVDRVSLVIVDKIKSPLRFLFEKDSISIDCTTAIGKSQDYVNVELLTEPYPVDELLIGFNDKYMRDILRNIPADEFTLNVTSGTTPMVVLPADGSDKFKYMILPVRLRAD